MERSNMLNEYVKENEENKESFSEASHYLEGLKLRIKDSKTLTELMIEVSNFLDKFDVNDEVKNDIIKICNSFDENTDIYSARTKLEGYLSNYLEEKEDNYQESNNTVNEIKEEVIDDAAYKLKNVGVELVGNSDDVIEKIADNDSVERIQNNVDNAKEYFEERNEIVDEEAPSVEVSLDTINEIVDSPKDNIILNDALEAQDNMMESSNPSLMEFKDDGSLEVSGDKMNPDAMNFIAMLTNILVASSENLDMKFIKNRTEKFKYKVLFGNFPLVNHPENKLDPVIVSKIQQEANSYQGNINYMDLLGANSPELKEALVLLNQSVIGENGAFQMAVNNTENKNDLLFAMDENYSNIMDAFSNNGAIVKIDAEEHGIVYVHDDLPGNQLITLATTNEELAAEKEKKQANNIELKNSYQYVKKIDLPNVDQAAKVSYILLGTVAVTEILFVVFYLLHLFLG